MTEEIILETIRIAKEDSIRTGRPCFILSNGKQLKTATTPFLQNCLKEKGCDVLGVGKIYDIFAGRGLTATVRTKNNEDGIIRTLEHMKEEFHGLCFTNLVDFDMVYGHRNDTDGYAKALTAFDRAVPQLLEGLKEEDILMITADHGCDPATESTDHSREYIPLLICGPGIKQGVNLGTRKTFADIGASILEYFGCDCEIAGESFLKDVLK